MAVVVSPPPPKTDGKFDDWMYLFWKKVISAVITVIGIPAGGASGTVLSKIDGTDYNVEWIYPVLGFLPGEGAGGIGYQVFSKSSGVTLNKKCGTIVMHDEGLNDSTSVSFYLFNSYIEDTDVVVVTIKDGATLGAYLTQVEHTSTGYCSIALRNVYGSILFEEVQLNFVIIKSYDE